MDDHSKRRLWIDESHTFDSSLNTGIQRVVRNLSKHLPTIAHNEDVECRSVVWRQNTFHDRDAYERRWGTRSFRQWKQTSKRSTSAYLCAKLYYSGRSLIQYASRSASQIRWRRGDTLLLPDGYWAMNSIWPAVRRARQQGVRVCVVLYDLIPIRHPEYFPDRNLRPFQCYLDNIIRSADVVACISNAVKQDYENYIATHFEQAYATSNPNASQRVVRFRLGADISQSSKSIDHDDPIRKRLMDGGDNFFLQVGTIEPRKNHSVVLDAMDSLWQRGVAANYIMVGRMGWMTEALQQRIRNHPQLNRRLFHLDHVDDAMLSQLYRHCTAVLCPSFAEGFGLPIVEGLHAGRNVIASDIAIHREVGGDACEYFNVCDAIGLATLLMQQLSHPSLPASNVPFVGVASWHDSASELMRQIMS